MPASPVQIVKASGKTEAFDEAKLRMALARSGADEAVIARVVEEVRDGLVDGMSTRRLYRIAFKALKRRTRRAAGRFGLRDSIMKLGPSGYAFELFWAAVLAAEGYETQAGIELEGRCVTHEVDVLAVQANRRVGCECKFHNRMGTKSDLKTALYVHARAMDLCHPDAPAALDEFWLVTNTKFTTEAIRYGACAGLPMLSWDYPVDQGVAARVHRAGLHPVTCLTELSGKEKHRLLEAGVVLAREIAADATVLEAAGVVASRAGRALEEARKLID